MKDGFVYGVLNLEMVLMVGVVLFINSRINFIRNVKDILILEDVDIGE